MSFLPTTREECEKGGFSEPDFVLVTGDGYVDHPSFGAAVIGRVLESRGYRVAVLAQPDFRDTEDFRRFGRPRLGFLITGGNVDSMVNHFSVFKHRRKTDAYSPGGVRGKRPDRAVIVYANRVREAYKGVPVILGGLEASLRRFGHYDYWDDRVRRSILLDAKGDILVYGMGERAVVEIAEALDSGIAVREITWIRGTCYTAKEIPPGEELLLLPPFACILDDKKAYAESFVRQYKNTDPVTGKRLAEEYEKGWFVVQNPPQSTLEREELDGLYALPFERTYAPQYKAAGGIPAVDEVRFSITANRGCFGGCAFCALTYHQGREVRSRSKDSIVDEAVRLTALPGFKGYIHDVGGPTANFRNPGCQKQIEKGVCRDKDCLFPGLCAALEPDHSEYLDVLRAVRQVKGVKKAFIRSGIRYDYLMADPDDSFFRELCRHHVSGTLKIAPEHVSKRVLAAMHKPGKETFQAFKEKYRRINEALGLKQYLIPYFISSHPGSTLDDAVELALFLKETGFVPDQVQDFYPTPGTLSTCMYHTEMDPFTKQSLYVPKTLEEKRMDPFS